MHSPPQAPTLPAGFHSAMPYLIFDGTAAKAIAFYCEVFGATELPGRLTDQAGRVLDAAIMTFHTYLSLRYAEWNSANHREFGRK
jgi:hypothetical protein